MRKNRFTRMLVCLAACVLSVASLCEASDGTRWTYTAARDANNNICIDFEEVRVMLPASWDGKYEMTVSGDEVSFFHRKSRELWSRELGFESGGFLFSVNYTQDFNFMDLPSYKLLGKGADGVYFATFPTDLQAYTEDAEAYKEWAALSEDMEWVTEHLTVTQESSWSEGALAQEYILPQSSAQYLRESDLSGMDADRVQMAINEIYARHHRRFILEDVQSYFDSMSWYDGYIEPEEFDVTVMNQYESANISMMAACLERMTSGSVTD